MAWVMPRSLGTPIYLRSKGQQETLAVTPSKYPTHVKLKVGSKSKKVPVTYFWKDAIQVGDYVHPLTGQKFSVDRSRIDHWVGKFNRMKRAGVEVPTPVDHSEAAEDNRGFVVDARRNGDKLKLLHQAIGKDAAIVAARNRCSVYIDPDFRDGNGKRWGEVIAHSAYTPKPVVHGQGAFVPFAASRGAAMRTVKVPAFYFARKRHKESAMPATMTAAVSLLSKKEKVRLRKLLKLDDNAKIKSDELAGSLLELPVKRRKAVLDTLNAAKLRAAKAKRAAAKGGDGDDEDEDDDSDDDDDDDDDIDDELDDDLDDEDEDEDMDEDEDEEEPSIRRNKPAKIAASRVAGRIDQFVAASAYKTECDATIRSGRVTPETIDRINRLFTDRKGRPNALALSAVPGTVDPLAFKLLKILRHNRQVPMGGKTQSQAFAASRIAPTGKKAKAEEKELKELRKETEEWAARRNGKKQTASAKSE